MKNTFFIFFFALVSAISSCQKENCSELADFTIAAFEQYEATPDSATCAEAIAAFQYYSDNCEMTDDIQRAIDSVMCPE